MAWIPEKFAIKGKFLKIKKNDIWDDGWEVIGFSEAVMSAKEADEHSQLFKKARKASDI